MSFYERYELLELDRDDGVKTFQAREIATGRPVKVHLFVAPSSPYQAQLLRKIDQLPESERARVLDRGKHEGTRYVVTDRLADHPGLFEWISAGLKSADGRTPLETAGARKAPLPAAAPAVPSRTDLNREFADLFKTTERPIFSLPPEPAAAAPAAPSRETKPQAPPVRSPAVPPGRPAGERTGGEPGEPR